MKRSRLAIGIGLLLLLVIGGGSRMLGLVGGDDAAAPAGTGPRARQVGTGLAGELARGRSGGIDWTPSARSGVAIAGTVIDVKTRAPVGGVEVVFRSEAGEQSTTARPDGTYRIEVPPGTYRAFVRDETVLSVGRVELVRLPGMPALDTVGAPDEALMPVVIARADAEGVDLTVMRGGAIHGRVVDRAGKPIAGALLRARGGAIRPTLGTDVTESDASGRFELRLAAGEYALEASHARFAGIANAERIELEPGDVKDAVVTLIAGCVVAGRVVAPGGHAAGDGAIERMWGTGPLEFAPTGRIGADGSFRWVTTEEAEITLRAWPWKSPPSLGQRFACRDGARFESVVFELPDRAPDIEGLLVDYTGAPVALAYIDLMPLDSGGIVQQERTDAEGRWSVYQMPDGRYRATASAPGRGVVSAVVHTREAGIRLALGGTGRIEGTTPLIDHGSFEVALVTCGDDDTGPIRLPQDRRLVTITAGRFAIDDVPACPLQFSATWQGKPSVWHAEVPAGGTAQLELSIGPLREKVVHGLVRDASGRPVEGASITAVAADEDGHAEAVTDGAGRFTIRTFAGATVLAYSATAGIGSVELGTGDEAVEITLAPEEREIHDRAPIDI